mmetsp:Transcript_76699/g.201260  ORF Transcript_76699/g.201260 Transcript_76699/m.201260 type:complete len:201 (-) Transcript_76699:22-624(-)
MVERGARRGRRDPPGVRPGVRGGAGGLPLPDCLGGFARSGGDVLGRRRRRASVRLRCLAWRRRGPGLCAGLRLHARPGGLPAVLESRAVPGARQASPQARGRQPHRLGQEAHGGAPRRGGTCGRTVAWCGRPAALLRCLWRHRGRFLARHGRQELLRRVRQNGAQRLQVLPPLRAAAPGGRVRRQSSPPLSFAASGATAL